MSEQDQPLVCICIPTYNAAATIGATLASVLNQSYFNLRVLVVDNQSSDGTADIVSEVVDERVVLYRNERNLGGEGNFNRCIDLASGKYMAIYHADDIYEPEMIATQVQFMEANPQAVAVFTEASLIDQSGRFIGELRQPRDLEATGPIHEFPEIFRAILRHSNFLICPSVMALTQTYQQNIKAWRGDIFGSSADLDVWLRMSQMGSIGILAKKTMRYRISTSQGSEQVRRDIRRAPFFDVVDHYLAQGDVRRFLSASDFFNYQCLERRDRAMRAANALVAGQVNTARSLCPDVFSAISLHSALRTQRGFIVFVLSFYIKGMLSLRLYALAGRLLGAMKKWTGK